MRVVVSRRATRWVAAGICVAAVLGTTIWEFTRPREEVVVPRNRARSAANPPPQQLIVVERLRLARAPQSATLLAATNRSGTTILAPDRKKNTLTLRPVAHLARAVVPRPVQIALPFRPDALDVGPWSLNESLALLSIAEHGRRTALAVRSILTGKRLFAATVPTVARAPSAHRTYALRLWSGTLADLVLVDRNAPRKTLRVRVLSGESNFTKTLLDASTQRGAGFPASQFWLEVGALSRVAPTDLVFITRSSNTGSRALEIHILSARSKYSAFLMQIPTTVSARTGSQRHALLAYSGGRPVIMSIDLNHHIAEVLPLDHLEPRKT
jgi:hypothetical protein